MNSSCLLRCLILLQNFKKLEKKMQANNIKLSLASFLVAILACVVIGCSEAAAAGSSSSSGLFFLRRDPVSLLKRSNSKQQRSSLSLPPYKTYYFDQKLD